MVITRFKTKNKKFISNIENMLDFFSTEKRRDLLEDFYKTNLIKDEVDISVTRSLIEDLVIKIIKENISKKKVVKDGYYNMSILNKNEAEILKTILEENLSTKRINELSDYDLDYNNQLLETIKGLEDLEENEVLTFFEERDLIKEKLEEKDNLIREKEVIEKKESIKEILKELRTQNFLKQGVDEYLSVVTESDRLKVEDLKVDYINKKFVRKNIILDKYDNVTFEVEETLYEKEKRTTQQFDLEGDPLEYYDKIDDILLTLNQIEKDIDTMEM